jgi:molybdopterin adenylyltransferase
VRAAVLTISTRVARSEAEDTSGLLLARLAEEAGCDVVGMEVVPDDPELIIDRMHHWVEDAATFLFCTGGTGFTPDDFTPESALEVIERRATGIEHALHAEAQRRHPMGALSRAVAGISAGTLIVTFPGSPRAIEELFGVVAPLLEHASALLRGDRDAHGPRSD